MSSSNRTRTRDPVPDINVSIHLNKLLNSIAKALDALETFNIPKNKTQVVDYGARLGILTKRLANLTEDCKDRLWDNLEELESEGYTIKGERFVACMQIILQERFNVKGFKEVNPEEHARWLHSTIVCRSTFKPRS